MKKQLWLFLSIVEFCSVAHNSSSPSYGSVESHVDTKRSPSNVSRVDLESPIKNDTLFIVQATTTMEMENTEAKNRIDLQSCRLCCACGWRTGIRRRPQILVDLFGICEQLQLLCDNHLHDCLPH